MKPSEVLIGARKKIDNPENWWNGHATDKVLSDDYCCMLTAIRKDPFLVSNHAMGILAGVTRGSIITFNDTHSHAEVLAAFDRAIEIAQEDEKYLRN